MDHEVSILLSIYKRPYSFEEQYAAILNQTYQNINIFVLATKVEDVDIPDYILDMPETFYREHNLGVWDRFQVAMGLPGDYICIIDDDTIPGHEWINNCLDTYHQYPGVITTRGVRLNYGKDHLYPHPSSYEAHGWCNQNEEAEEVDIGCHSWFFNKNLLHHFWKHAPRKTPMNYGEDMHLSYVAQKIGGKTHVAPHPKNNMEMWGSNPRTGHEYGSDKNAISWNNEANQGMNEYYNYLKKHQDFKIIAET